MNFEDYKWISRLDLPPVLSLDEERGLVKVILNSGVEERDQAKKKLIHHNLRLVIEIAKDYLGNNISLEYLFSEGIPGLIKAVDKYRLDKNAKFSTYAAWWIKQHIGGSVRNLRGMIRLPSYIHDNISKFYRVKNYLTDIYRKEPTDEEVYDEIGWSPKKRNNVSLSKLSFVSLDSKVNEENDSELHDLIGEDSLNKDDPSVEDYHEVRIAMNSLKQREKEIIEYRFGLNGNDGREYTLDELGERYNLTRERIRQIEGRALKKLYRKLSSRNTNYQGLARFINNGK